MSVWRVWGIDPVSGVATEFVECETLRPVVYAARSFERMGFGLEWEYVNMHNEGIAVHDPRERVVERPLIAGEAEALPNCERCGRAVYDDMTAEFAPFCSAKCREDAAKVAQTCARFIRHAN